MLGEPTLDSPLNEEAAVLFRNNRSEYDKKVKNMVKQHAQKKN